jgi:hypothetical protein
VSSGENTVEDKKAEDTGESIATAVGSASGHGEAAAVGRAVVEPSPDNPAAIGAHTAEIESKALRRYLIDMGVDARWLDAAKDRAMAIHQMSKMSDRETGILMPLSLRLNWTC